VRDFYREVVGWKHFPVDMGGYSDFNMLTPTSDKSTAGICHARGVNEGLPPQWLIYITVENIEKSAARCIELGGKLLVQIKGMGSFGRYCVIQDLAGAVAALIEPP
jgi:predicted enzyme related to lactoylglutathione lyase